MMNRTTIRLKRSFCKLLSLSSSEDNISNNNNGNENSNEEQDHDDKVIRLKYPQDVDDFLEFLDRKSSSSKQKPKTRERRHIKHHNYQVVVDAHLFGCPRMPKLTWTQRQDLFRAFGTFDRLTSLILEGTIMGQVLSCETISLAVTAPHLKVLHVLGGMIIDDASSVCTLAQSLWQHASLEEVRFSNFLNHVLPFDDHHNNNKNCTQVSLLDPLLYALSTVSSTTPPSSNLQVLELSCLAYFVAWKKSLISTKALHDFLFRGCCNGTIPYKGKDKLSTSPSPSLPLPLPLTQLNLTNLGLQDEQFHVIAMFISNNNLPILTELILNANDNTQAGLLDIIQHLRPIPSYASSSSSSSCCLIRLEIANHVKIHDATCRFLVEYLIHPSCRLQYFMVTHGISSGNDSNNNSGSGKSKHEQLQDEINMYLQLHRAIPELQERFYSPMATIQDSINVLWQVVQTFEGNHNDHDHNHNHHRPRDTNNNNTVTILYTLLRDKPQLCQVVSVDEDDDDILGVPTHIETGLPQKLLQKASAAAWCGLILLTVWISMLLGNGCGSAGGGAILRSTTCTHNPMGTAIPYSGNDKTTSYKVQQQPQELEDTTYWQPPVLHLPPEES